MRELESTMTVKGQVTIPSSIRTQLGLQPHDRVRFALENGVVTLKPVPSNVLRHFGSVTPHHQPEDWRALREQVEQLMADDVAGEDT